MLLRTHQRPRSPDLEVAHRYAHAATQVLVLVDRGETIGRLGREGTVDREHEVCEGLDAPSPHASLELVELGEAQAL